MNSSFIALGEGESPADQKWLKRLTNLVVFPVSNILTSLSWNTDQEPEEQTDWRDISWFSEAVTWIGWIARDLEKKVRDSFSNSHAVPGKQGSC